jgi:hypothetical protein
MMALLAALVLVFVVVATMRMGDGAQLDDVGRCLAGSGACAIR